MFKEFHNPSVEIKTLSIALGFEPRSFDCRSIERPGLESQRSRKRLYFHRRIIKFFKYCDIFFISFYGGNLAFNGGNKSLGRKGSRKVASFIFPNLANTVM